MPPIHQRSSKIQISLREHQVNDTHHCDLVGHTVGAVADACQGQHRKCSEEPLA